MELCKGKNESRIYWIFIFNVGHIGQFFLESRACKKNIRILELKMKLKIKKLMLIAAVSG